MDLYNIFDCPNVKDTVKDYLYNKLGDAVYRDSEYYWWMPNEKSQQPAHVIRPYIYAVKSNAKVGIALEKKLRCRVTKKPRLVKTCAECGGVVEKGFIVRKSKKGKECYTPIKLCVQCGTVYLSFNDFGVYSDVLECENVDELHKLQEERITRSLSQDTTKKLNEKKEKPEVKIKATVLWI